MKLRPLVIPFVLVLSVAYVMFAWNVTAQDKSHASAGSFKPVQSLETMMHGQKKLFDQIKSAITDDKLKDGVSYAWLLAEVANVNHYQKDDPAYQTLADKMSQQSVKLAELMEKGDAKLAKNQFSQIGRTCGACHDQFNKKK
jgi:cytochrome c556